MKKKYLIWISLLAIIMIYTIPFISANDRLMNVNFQGTWKSNNPDISNFTIKLSQESDSIFGQHCIIALHGKKVDCPLDMGIEMKSIQGVLKEKTAEVLIKSAWSDKLAKAKIEWINNETIKWTLIDEPSWEHYFPKSISLKRQ